MKEAYSLDLDGVVFRRVPVQTKALWDYLWHGTNIYRPPTEISEFERIISYRSLSAYERFFLSTHKKRRVPDEVKDYLANLRDVDVYGNTGRPNQQAWIKVTRENLEEEGILGHFVDIFLEVKG